MKNSIILLLILLLNLNYLYSQSLELLLPNKTIGQYQSIYYGEVGPGQTFIIKINPIVRDKNGEFLGQWDLAQVSKMPEGWKAVPSKIYANPLVVEITSPKYAEDGEYSIEIEVIDEKNQENIGGKFVFEIIVKINKKVVSSTIIQKPKVVGAGQPARFVVEIENLGNAKDVFVVSLKGVKQLEFEKYVYIPPKENRTVVFEFTEPTAGKYSLLLEVKSLSSPKIATENKIDFIIKTDLATEYRACLLYTS
ncbi:MAG: hypothetical protein N3D10_01165, partial [Candidatus Micrarchaeota archaeon]|nr:hypothetical protein [Candidatus Micrarchaeota archaeon]